MANVLVVINYNSNHHSLPVMAKYCADITLHTYKDDKDEMDVKIIPFVSEGK